MPASDWSFSGNGLLYKAGAWQGDDDELHAYVQPTIAGVRVTELTPMPVREPVRGTPLAQVGVSMSTTSGTLRSANAARRIVDIYNASAVNLWLRFGAAAAVVGVGAFVPPGASTFFFTTAEVRGILESGSPVTCGIVEWD